jgi:hypothetical protein
MSSSSKQGGVKARAVAGSAGERQAAIVRAKAAPNPPAQGRPVTGPVVTAPVFAGAWLLKTSGVEYLDVEVDSKTGEMRFVSVPASQLRHAFRVHRVEDLRARQWQVHLEPVALALAAPPPARQPLRGRAKATAAPGDRRIPMRLVHHGCLDFEIRAAPAPKAAPEPGAAGRAALRAGPAAPAMLRLPAGAQVKLDLGLEDLARPGPPVPFPAFTGHELRALQAIGKQLRIDPRSEHMDQAALDLAERPDDVPEAAWKAVRKQLLVEIHCRNQCRPHFDALTKFVQNVFIGSAELVSTIGRLIQLDDSQTVHMAAAGMLNAVASAVSLAPFPGSGVVSAGLKVVFQIATADRGPGAAEIAVALAGASGELTKLFDGLITSIQNVQRTVFSDWGKLQVLSQALDAESGAYCWPRNDEPQRKAARRELEIALWQSLLKLKWHNSTSSDSPVFVEAYNDVAKAAHEAAYPQHWVKYWAGQQRNLGKTKNGFYVEDHWLGYGGAVPFNTEASAAMCERLFATLGVPRTQVFNDASWGLQAEVCHVPNYDNYFPGY